MDYKTFFVEFAKTIVNLITGLAWPILIGFLLIALFRNGDRAAAFLDRFMAGKQAVEAGVGAGGVTFKVTMQQIVSGLSQQTSDSGSATKPSPERIEATASKAVTSFSNSSLLGMKLEVKVLWVDDHPENNIGLQLAFQALGISVICIGNNDAISSAFDAAESPFDFVITDMFRDQIGEKKAEPQAGLATLRYVADHYKDTAVIIYAGWWAAQHVNDTLQAPLVGITNDPTTVFELVTSRARSRATSRKPL